jgi:hypothetical protein
MKVPEGVALAVLLACMVLRAIISSDAFPLWSEDPAVVPAAVTALTPAGSLVVDAMMLLASAVVIRGAGRDGRNTPVWMTALASLGACGTLLHAYVLHKTPSAFQLEHLTLGASWSAGIFAALAIRAAAMDVRARGLIVACLVGLIGPLAAKGVVQVFVDHPQTLAAFNENKTEMLAVRGWSEDSPMARAFIRRLSQPEASGWIGLSNVYSSFAAFASVALVACAFALARTRAMLFDLVALGTAVAALALSKSKGGLTSTIAVGLPILGASLLLLRARRRATHARSIETDAPHPNSTSLSHRAWHRVLSLAGPACIVFPLLAVVLRGLAGERLTELSLFFRWFYMQGAARIFTRHPLVGVGPDGFQEAYLLAKPVLSPEAVASPHSILLDWLSTLGLFGLAWCVLLVTLAISLGRSIGVSRGIEPSRRDEPSDVSSHQLRVDLRVLFLVVALPTLLASWIETPGTSIEGMLARFVGLALAVGVGLIMLLAHRRDATRTMLGVAAGALAVLAHAQIELTGVNPGSCAWLLAVIAVAGSPAASSVSLRSRGSSLGAIASLVMAIALLLGVPTPFRWERELRAAAREVAVLAEANALMRESSFRSDQASRREMDAAIQLLVSAAGPGATPPTSQAELGRLVDRVLIDRLPRAESHLASAARILPSHFATHQALSRVRAQFAEVLQRNALRDDAVRVSTLAITELEAQVHRDPTRASVWSWLATLTRAHATLLRDDSLLVKACEAWEQAAALDPHAITHQAELARTYARLGRSADARRWAKQALDNNAHLRLDPLQGLSDRARAEMERLAR